ncbi:MAG TPA: hypothetical protein VD772_08955, partial [Anseongella sp.]|nr:hypothetical protein [Anseongella sp.]
MSTSTSVLCAVMRDTRYLAGAILILSILQVSCSREIPEPRPEPPAAADQRKPATEKERLLVNRIRDAAFVLNAIYEDPAVVAEVNAAIATGYYEDERVLLADLLYPENSVLCLQAQAKQAESGNAGTSIRWGLFSKRFREAAASLLTEANAARVVESAGGSGPLAGQGLSIYYPYSEEFEPGRRPLIVPATVEGDWVDIPDPACPHRHE